MEKRFSTKPKNGVNAKGRSTMQKRTDFRSAVVILAMLFGILAPTYADAVEDFSGDWSGTLYSITYNMSRYLHISLTQNGSSVVGTFTIIGALCGPINDFPLTGNVIWNTLSFDASGYCGGHYLLFKASQGVLTENQISGGWNTYEDGVLHGVTTYNVRRSINTINATAGTGGIITPAGNVSVTAGTNQTFNILPDDGYKIQNVIVDGVSIGAVASYTFTNVSANHAFAL